jgi:hypothetical protein
MPPHIPFQSVTIAEHPEYLPSYLTVIVFETCVFCRHEITTREGWSTSCPKAPEGIHQKRLIIVDARSYRQE